MGVRMALGAAPGDVQWMVLAEGLRITELGILGGLLLSVAAVNLLRGFLFGLSPFDPVAFATAGIGWRVLLGAPHGWIRSPRSSTSKGRSCGAGDPVPMAADGAAQHDG